MDRRQDPRTLVTPYAFSVHPDLLGMPLATPWQRLGAIAIDGVVIVGLSKIGGLTLAAASSLLLFWLAFRGPGQDVIGKLFRVAAGCMGLMVGTIAILFFIVLPYLSSDSEGEGGDFGRSGVALVDEVVASLEAELGEDPEDTGVGPESAVPITDPQALDSIQALNALVQKLDEELQDAESEVRQANTRMAETEEESLFGVLTGFLDDLGLGFGWGALYLTIAHALLKGSSVGKKLFRIRVVMIDLRPLTWWLSFERVGGYAAGLATGLLGFAQIFWDPNRQAIHDKVSETVVIQVGKDPVPGPWMAEGGAQWDRSRSRPPGVQY